MNRTVAVILFGIGGLVTFARVGDCLGVAAAAIGGHSHDRRGALQRGSHTGGHTAHRRAPGATHHVMDHAVAGSLFLRRVIRTTATTMTLPASSIDAVTRSPARAQPSTTATSGFTYVCVITVIGDVSRSA